MLIKLSYRQRREKTATAAFKLFTNHGCPLISLLVKNLTCGVPALNLQLASYYQDIIAL